GPGCRPRGGVVAQPSVVDEDDSAPPWIRPAFPVPDPSCSGAHAPPDVARPITAPPAAPRAASVALRTWRALRPGACPRAASSTVVIWPYIASTAVMTKSAKGN